MTGFSEDSAPQAEMPRYKSHKIVHALKIKALEQAPGYEQANIAPGPLLMTSAEEGYAPFVLESAYVAKHRPHVGGYYVVYPDGYKSFSPAKAFEDGYTKV